MIYSSKIIVIAGPTASGKTDLGIKLAKKLNGEIVNADSVSMYKGLNIGSAKPSVLEQSSIKHYMIDVVNPDVDYSVYDYVKNASECIDMIFDKGKIPIIVGGTGFYIKALLYKNSIDNNTFDKNIRNDIITKQKEFGNQYMWEWLQRVDIETSNELNINDTRRVMRAIEIYLTSGQAKSSLIKNDGQPIYNFDFFVLDINREELYSNINTRVDVMFDNGLIEEVKSLYNYKDFKSLQTIGYKQVIDYLGNKVSLQDTIQLVKQKTRNFAKRQITFFKSFRDAVWINKTHIMEKYEL